MEKARNRSPLLILIYLQCSKMIKFPKNCLIPLFHSLSFNILWSPTILTKDIFIVKDIKEN